MSYFKERRGFGLIVAVVALLILSLTAVLVVSLVSTDSEIALYQHRSTDSSYIARAGIERALYEYKNGQLCDNLDYGPTSLGSGSYTTTGTRYNPTGASRTTLSAGISNTAPTIPVGSTTNYAAHGRIKIDSEEMDYTGKTSTSFTGVKRGTNGTTAASHSSGTSVDQDYCLVNSTGTIPTITDPLGKTQKVMEAGMVGSLSSGIKSVQNASVTMPINSNLVTVSSPQFSAVDPTKSFLVFSLNFNVTTSSWAAPRNLQVRGQIINSGTQLQFARANATAPLAINIEWYVAEFNSGVSVQRGTINITGTTNPVNQSLPTAVDPTKSVPIISFARADDDFGADNFVEANLLSCSPNCTTLELKRCIGNPADLEWQVITFTNAKVFSGNTQFGPSICSTSAEGTTDSGNITFCTVGCPPDTTTSWLIFNNETRSGNVANIGAKMIQGQITSNSQVRFRRDISDLGADWTWYVVVFNDGTKVKYNNGYSTFTSSQTSKTIPDPPEISYPIDRTKSIVTAAGYYMYGGKTPYKLNDDPGVGSVTLDMPSDSQLTLTRGETQSTTADINWQVVTFAVSSGGSFKIIDFREVY